MSATKSPGFHPVQPPTSPSAGQEPTVPPTPVTLENYSSLVSPFARYRDKTNGTALEVIRYPVMKLVGECGELLSKIRKSQCATVGGTELFVTTDSARDILLEVGDGIWYCQQLYQHVTEFFPSIARGTFATTAHSLCVDSYPISSALEQSTEALLAASCLSEEIAKAFRDDNSVITDDRAKTLAFALEQCTQRLLLICRQVSALEPEHAILGVLHLNYRKILGRASRGTLGGSGDHR